MNHHTIDLWPERHHHRIEDDVRCLPLKLSVHHAHLQQVIAREMASNVMEHLKRQAIPWPTQTVWPERCMIGYVFNWGLLIKNMILHTRHARSHVDAGWYVWCFRSENFQNFLALLRTKATREKLRGEHKAAATKVSEWW